MKMRAIIVHSKGTKTADDDIIVGQAGCRCGFCKCREAVLVETDCDFFPLCLRHAKMLQEGLAEAIKNF